MALLYHFAFHLSSEIRPFLKKIFIVRPIHKKINIIYINPLIDQSNDKKLDPGELDVLYVFKHAAVLLGEIIAQASEIVFGEPNDKEGTTNHV